MLGKEKLLDKKAVPMRTWREVYPIQRLLQNIVCQRIYFQLE